jgi:protocatechuate 3,4-dioxygenase beta subunit
MHSMGSARAAAKYLRAMIAGLAAGALLVSGVAQVANADTTTPVLTGLVTNASNAGIEGAEVLLCPWVDESAPACGGENAVRTTTGANGEYSIPLSGLAASTDYAVSVAAGGYWTTWLGGAVGTAPSTKVTGSYVSVGDSDSDVAVGTVSMPKKYQLTGSVVDGADAGISGVSVELWQSGSSDDPADEDATASDGKFSLNIPYATSGLDYELLVHGGSFYADNAQELTLLQQDKSVGAIALTATRSNVSGKVTDAQGLPLANADVTSLRWDTGDDAFGDFASTTTDDQGKYTVGVRVGERFTIRYQADGYATQYLGGGRNRPATQDAAGATSEAPAAGQTAELSDVQLAVAHRVTGTILLPGLDPARNVQVTVYPAGHTQTDQPISESQTNSDGSFEVDVESGTYDFEFANSNEDLAAGTLLQAAVMIDGDRDFGELSLPATGDQVSGSVIDSAGAPISGARITSYTGGSATDEVSSSLTAGLSVLSDASGNFVLPIPHGVRFTFKARLNGYQTRWYSLVDTAPTQLSDDNSLVASAGLTVAAITLFGSDSSLGKVAGQKLSYCNAHTLRANDDGSTKATALPFALKFYGVQYSSIYVNNNGNVTFGKSLSKYTPGDLTSADQPAPMIAPFFADVDTRNDASWEVTYGSSPSGDVFCVNWATVGYFAERADKLNVVQLLLTKREGVAGRAEGDFDITFNYDQIGWETGEASDGTDGLGGTSAAVGYTAGTGDPGTYFQLLGSLTPGSFLDSGPRALIAGQLNSSQVGRYRFEIRNGDAQVKVGELRGLLNRASDGSTVSNATVQACRVGTTDTSNCQFVTSGSDGSFSFPNLGAGDYNLEVSPPGALRGLGKKATVAAGQVTDLGTISLSEPDPIPSGSSITSVGSDGGVPVVYYAEPLQLSVPNPCGAAAPTGTWTVNDAAGTSLHSGSLAVSGSSLVATIPQLYPYHGTGRVETTVTCGGAAASSPAFDIYIDPSGTVYDRFGAPLVGASVTLLRADTSDGDFAAVPEGSTLMDSSNRTNPVVVGDTGAFQWNVASGWYKLTVAKAGCDPVTTAAMEVPPARIDLGIKLTCGAAPTAVTPMKVTGEASLGSTLTVHEAAFAAGSPYVHQSFTWKRDGVVVGSAATYTITAADLGHSLSVSEVSGAPSKPSNVGSEQLSFDSFESSPAQSWTLPLGVFQAPTPVIVAPAVLKPGTTLTVKTGTWSPAADLRISWLVGGVAVAGSAGSGASYRIQLADLGKPIAVSVTGVAAGYQTTTVTSASVTAKAYRLTATPAPKVSGTVKVGKTLKAVVKKWKPSPVHLSYQWLRNGKVITGAVAAKYRITTADIGAKISVRVSGSKVGYATVAKTSKPTKKVAKKAAK